MIHMSRDNFRYLAAGKFVLGKGPVDPKHLEVYVESAMMTWDFLTAELRKEYANGIEKRENKTTGPQLVSSECERV